NRRLVVDGMIAVEGRPSMVVAAGLYIFVKAALGRRFERSREVGRYGIKWQPEPLRTAAGFHYEYGEDFQRPEFPRPQMKFDNSTVSDILRAFLGRQEIRQQGSRWAGALCERYGRWLPGCAHIYGYEGGEE
ncbi:MAG TPA: hypothetical protein VGE01_09695, partial [Fimbriimonas sp.]